MTLTFHIINKIRFVKEEKTRIESESNKFNTRFNCKTTFTRNTLREPMGKVSHKLYEATLFYVATFTRIML